MARPAPPFASLIISGRKLQLNCNQIKEIFYTSCRLNHGPGGGRSRDPSILIRLPPERPSRPGDILSVVAPDIEELPR
jgi:hypothetical protein